MNIFEFVVVGFGLGLFIFRLSPELRAKISYFSVSMDLGSHPDAAPAVSIVIPVRNEEEQISQLIGSLLQLQYHDFEVIIVDDHSTDRTREILTSLPFEKMRVLVCPLRPPEWVGKSYACDIGAQHARGEYILFTDADTAHRPASLRQSIQFMKARDLDMMSALPYHACKLWWEPYVLSFHLLVLAVSSPFSRFSENRVFAIGQYLLLKKSAYVAMGGHAHVRSSLAEDLDLAKRALQLKFKYAVFPLARLYDVQMFTSFRDFFAGWRRLQTVGLSKSSFWTVLSSIFMVAALATLIALTASAAHALMGVGLMLFMALRHRNYGAFHPVSVLLYPLGILLFIAVSVVALFDRYILEQVTWRGRKYPLK